MTFHYVRWTRYLSTGKVILQGAAHPDGPWHRLTKRETAILEAMRELPPKPHLP